MLAVAAIAAALYSPQVAAAGPSSQAFLVFTEPMSYEQALRHPILAGLGRTGGLGLFTTPDQERAESGFAAEAVGAEALEAAGVEVIRCCGPNHARSVRSRLQAADAEEILVIAIPEAPTARMVQAGDDVLPVALARGAPADLFPICSTIVQSGGGSIEALPGCLAGLTSDTTRRPGLVSSVDVGPTLLSFLDGRPPSDAVGTPIRVEDAAPTDLHARYLEYRRVHLPVGLLSLGLLLMALAVGAVVLARRRARTWAVAGAAIFGLGAVAFAVVLLPASMLPTFKPLILFPAALGGAALLTFAALSDGRRADPFAPVAFVAAAGLLLVVLDGVLRWRGLQMPLVGGSSMEGVRFYGLGNGFGGMLVGGGVLAASRLRPVAGTVVLAAAGLLAGLPTFGANLGVGLALFVAAGAWQALALTDRSPAVRIALGVSIAAALLALLLVAHRVVEMPTHVSRAIDAGDPVGTLLERFRLNLANTGRTPAAWLAVAILPVAGLVAWRRWGPFRDALTADPRWRDALVALAIAGIFGFVVNDTIGIAGMAFAFLLVGLFYPSLAMRWSNR